jgi:hypothetical protein
VLAAGVTPRPGSDNDAPGWDKGIEEELVPPVAPERQ